MQIKLERNLSGSILDIGGGGEGVIGRLYANQVIAIDNRQEELDEAPAGFEKRLMDATALCFENHKFDHVTSFYTMMFMDHATQAKAIMEASRVLRPGGSLHIWDAVIDSACPEPFLIDLDIELGGQMLHTTYGVVKDDAMQNVPHFVSQCRHSGLTLAEKQEVGLTFYLRFIKD